MELQEAFDAGFDAVKKYVDDAFDTFEKRILALEKRQSEALGEKSLAEAIAPVIKNYVQKATSGFRYLGTWDADRTYASGNFVTHGGSIWHCNHDTRAKPGDSADWTLACKRGADGRDAR